MTRNTTQHAPLIILLGSMVVSLAGLSLLPPIPQDPSYHDFADARSFAGIPNAWNVLSNLPFIAIGAIGLARCRDNAPVVFIFIGIFLTGFGSAYYHWSPNDRTLFWDRLPMTIAFMAILAVAVSERINSEIGALMLWPLLITGVLSLLVWRWTDDLRLYGWVQFFPCLALPVIFLFRPPKYTGSVHWVAAAVFYALAKAFEHFDERIYSITAQFVSGHTLKHLAAAAACFALLRYFQKRQPIVLTD